MITGYKSSHNSAIISRAFPWAGQCFEWIEKFGYEWNPQDEFVSDSIFVKKVEYETSPVSLCKYESHRSNIDLQWIFSGGEKICVLTPNDVAVDQDYDDKLDLSFYTTHHHSLPSEISMVKNSFAIFFPDDIHSCGWALNEGETVRKYVFKVNISVLH